MKRLFYLIALLFLLTSCFNKSKKYFRQAELLEEENKLEEAILYLDMAIAEDSEYLPAYINRGVDKSILGDYVGAIDDYTKVIEIDSTCILAFLNRGKNKSRQNNYSLAIEDYNVALNLKGYDEESYKDGFILLRIDNDFLGIDDGKTWLEPSIPEILYERGIAYYYIDSLKLALNDFNVCIRIGNRPETSTEFPFYSEGDCYYWRGLIFINSGNKEQTYKNFQQAALLGVAEAQQAISTYCQ